MKQMRHRVMPLNGLAAAGIDRELNFGSNGRCIFLSQKVQIRVPGLVGIDDSPKLTTAHQFSSVADLPAHGRITS